VAVPVARVDAGRIHQIAEHDGDMPALTGGLLTVAVPPPVAAMVDLMLAPPPEARLTPKAIVVQQMGRSPLGALGVTALAVLALTVRGLGDSGRLSPGRREEGRSTDVRKVI
jgi:hypothetical protein